MGSENRDETTPTPSPFVIATWLANPWAMMPEAIQHVLESMDIGAVEQMVVPTEPVAQMDETPRRNPAIAIVPAYGVLLPRPNLCMEMFGMGTALPSIVNAVRMAAENPRVEQIILDIDSPGGPVAGVMEAALELADIRAATDIPITAISRYVCASSAYWIACAAADKIVASPSSITGSIGVYAIHIDRSGAYDREGLNVELVSSGKYKVEAADTSSLSAEARAAMQRKADYYYAEFLEIVADARGASPGDIETGYGEGRVLTADDAMRANLVDEIASIDQYINQSRDQPRAELEEPVDVAAIIDQELKSRTEE